jgi:hypothetical protein
MGLPGSFQSPYPLFCGFWWLLKEIDLKRGEMRLGCKWDAKAITADEKFANKLSEPEKLK